MRIGVAELMGCFVRGWPFGLGSPDFVRDITVAAVQGTAAADLCFGCLDLPFDRGRF